jgi:hypothetical protein
VAARILKMLSNFQLTAGLGVDSDGVLLKLKVLWQVTSRHRASRCQCLVLEHSMESPVAEDPSAI